MSKLPLQSPKPPQGAGVRILEGTSILDVNLPCCYLGTWELPAITRVTVTPKLSASADTTTQQLTKCFTPHGITALTQTWLYLVKEAPSLQSPQSEQVAATSWSDQTPIVCKELVKMKGGKPYWKFSYLPMGI